MEKYRIEDPTIGVADTRDKVLWGTGGYKTRHVSESIKYIIGNGAIRSKREREAGDAGLGLVLSSEVVEGRREVLLNTVGP